MKTILHCETFNLHEAEGKAAYANLCNELSGKGLRPMKSFAPLPRERGAMERRNLIRSLSGHEVELDTKFLFDNQWNTGPVPGCDGGLRVFDWADSCFHDVQYVRQVQWLEVTDEMRQLRADTFACGYCSAQYLRDQLPERLFCTKCLGSEYLKVANLHLLRLRPIAEGRSPSGRYIDRPQLSDSERAFLEPAFVAARLEADEARTHALRESRVERVSRQYQKAKKAAEVEHAGWLWVLDNLPGMYENAIYYSHTGRWGFGWRAKIGDELIPGLTEKLANFPFDYSIECENGKTITNSKQGMDA